jgi:hypothetical protein
MGARKVMNRPEAIEQYVILRLRVEEVNRLDYLLNALKSGKVPLPIDSPFSLADLADTVRTAFLGWFASLTDREDKAVYAFDPLLALFPDRRAEIITVQLGLETCHTVLQQFRSNVAFHVRSNVAAHFKARRGLVDEDTYLDLISAIQDFRALMTKLIGEEARVIAELAEELKRLKVCSPLFVHS